MSFILDALRKSEHERQRTAMPGVAQVPFGLPRREMPVWATALIVVLAVALVALGGAWWKATRSAPADVGDASARRELPLALPAQRSSAVRGESDAARAGTDLAPARADTAAPPAQRTSPVARPTPPTRDFGATASGAGTTGAATAFSGRPTPEPAASPARSSSPPVSADPTLPSPAALAAEGVPVPPLRLELHAYAERPADRFVFINGTKYVEGARLAEGPEIVSIEPNGAVLSYLGHRFLLSTQ
jgi:general secretion pathway protein B